MTSPAPAPGPEDRVVLICGPAGSGKSTLAGRLAAGGAVVLSFDEEAWARGHRVHPLPDDAARSIHAELQRRLVALVRDGARVAVDTSFWSRASRESYRVVLRPLAVEPVVYYLATPRAVVLERLRGREGNGPHDVIVPADLAVRYLDGFEVPTADEGPLRILTGA
ncbi:AAA family ATPase [Miniimonas arenae]|uniref:AAA family ATPase n=1 Tax=Miniimonas arenae TaxID=676201 RepID=UPI001FE8904F|nr:ATP-binding protein [Miniimonas arenae]